MCEGRPIGGVMNEVLIEYLKSQGIELFEFIATLETLLDKQS